MMTLYAQKDPDASSVAQFLQRRVARVLPLYFLVVMLAYLLTQAGAEWSLPVTNKNVLAHLLLWHGTEVVWTIPVEFQFYFVFPVLWLVGFYSRGALLALMCVIVAVVLLIGAPEFPVVVKFLPFFLVGMGVAMLPSKILINKASGLMNVVFVAAMLGYILSFPRVFSAFGMPTPPSPWVSPAAYLIVPPLLLWSALSASLARPVLANPLAVYAGTISYSAYLLHYPILKLLGQAPLFSEHTGLYAVAFFTLTVALSSLSYFAFEAPLRAWISRLGMRRADRSYSLT